MAPVFTPYKKLLGFPGTLRLGSNFTRLERGQPFHQAALAAGGVVLMDHTFFGSLVDGADRLQHSFLCFGFSCVESSASLVDGSTGRAAHVAVIETTLLVLQISFDL